MESDTDSSGLSDCGTLSPPPPDTIIQCPSPPASQESSDAGSPCPDGMGSNIVVRSDDGAPPRKRRRVEKPRTTEHLDLRGPAVEESQQELLERLVTTMHKSRKIVVVAGAGISVSAGIPDFRSSTGLFTSLRAEHNLKGSGKHLFDASVYKDNSSTSSFHDMVRNMSKLTKNAEPTAFHHLLATLAVEDRLLRLYTQNVDGIDTKMPPLNTTVPLTKCPDGKWPKSVQLHGGLDKMVCSKCAELSEFDADLFDGPNPPVCGSCIETDRVRTDVAGKRSHGIGRLRPRMVLYNEHNPDEDAIGRVTQADLRTRPDAIIVVGTSLKIPGVRRIVKEMCGVVRGRRNGLAVWINNDPEPAGVEFKDCWDVVVRGEADQVAKHVAMRRHWEQPDSVEMTRTQWVEQTKERDHVIVNPTFKAVSTTADFRRASASPDFSPLVSRTLQFIDPDSTDSEIHTGFPPTPSKSARSSPSKKRKAETALTDLGTVSKTTAKPRGRPKSLPNSVTASKAKSKAVAKSTTGKGGARKITQTATMMKLTQTMKQTKSFATSAAKAIKSPKKTDLGSARSQDSKGSVMRSVPPENARVNAPSKTSTTTFQSMFPKLSPRKHKPEVVTMQVEKVSPMSIARLVS